jgi:hypothetical protein
VGQNARTECELLVEVALVEAIVAELQLRWPHIVEVSIQNAQWIEVCDVVTSHLVSTNEQLDLWGIMSQR